MQTLLSNLLLIWKVVSIFFPMNFLHFKTVHIHVKMIVTKLWEIVDIVPWSLKTKISSSDTWKSWNWIQLAIALKYRKCPSWRLLTWREWTRNKKTGALDKLETGPISECKTLSMLNTNDQLYVGIFKKEIDKYIFKIIYP